MTAEIPDDMDVESEFWKIAAETAKDAYFMHALNEIMDEGEDPDEVGAEPEDPDGEDGDGTYATVETTLDETRFMQLEQAFLHVIDHSCQHGARLLLEFNAGLFMEFRRAFAEPVEEDGEWDLDDPTSWI